MYYTQEQIDRANACCHESAVYRGVVIGIQR